MWDRCKTIGRFRPHPAPALVPVLTPHLAAGHGAPAHRGAGEDVAEEAGQREQHGHAGQRHDGQQAVAEHRDHAGQGHPRHRHQVQQAVHGHAAQQADAVDVVEVELPTL